MSLWHRWTEWYSSRTGDAKSDASKVVTRVRKIGNKGEDHAVVLLKKRGDRIVIRNWACKAGEIDIVSWDKETLVFVEVRTRASMNFGSPAESVDGAKQEKIKRAAHSFLCSRFREGSQPPCRYDVVWVILKDDTITDSGIIAGAFY
ncbi:MAG: YraN family protein [Planctomycetota bacterium]